MMIKIVQSFYLISRHWIAVLCACVLLGLNAPRLLAAEQQADETTRAEVSEQTSMQLLTDYLPTSCYHSGAYRQEKKLDGINQPLESQGNFIFSCQHGLIWHTQSPVTETAVYTARGKHFLVVDEQASPLDNRVHKALGTLLNHLMGGDTQYLLRNFTIEEKAHSLQLTPKHKRLKRAVQGIDITQHDALVTIRLAHSNSEHTRITIFDERVYDMLDATICREHHPTKARACTALFE